MKDKIQEVYDKYKQRLDSGWNEPGEKSLIGGFLNHLQELIDAAEHHEHHHDHLTYSKIPNPKNNHMTMEEYHTLIRIGVTHGRAFYATENNITNARIFPADFKYNKLDPKFTHVYWFEE